MSAGTIVTPDLFSAMTSPEAAELASASALRPVAVLPTGAVEQHGPHLPLALDIWLASAVARAAAQGQDGIRVCEPLPYGSSQHHRAFAGTMSLSPRTFIAVLCELAANLWQDGYLPVVLNGHGGNRAAIQVAITTLGADGVVMAGFSYFDLIADVAARVLTDHAGGTGHACALETALMMHVLPQTVRHDRIPEGTTPPSWPDPHLYSGPAVSVWRPFETIRPNGVIGTPSDATPAAGAALFEAAVTRSRDTLLTLQSHYGQRRPS